MIPRRPKVLLYDIETAPMEVFVWDIWQQDIGLNQIIKDWSIIAWSAIWLEDPESKIKYQDQRGVRDVRDDKKLVNGLRLLIDEADYVITQNGKRFDEKRVNTRLLIHGYKPYSPVKHIDTKEIAKRKFGFTSNKLEYLLQTLQAKHLKMTKREFEGMDLWRECLSGNLRAWREMEAYNKADVLGLRDLWHKFQPWDNSLQRNLFTDDAEPICSCGSKRLQCRGYAVTSAGKYHKYQCQDCGAWSRGARNLLAKEQRMALRRRVS